MRYTFASKLPQGFVWADGRASNIFPATEIFPAHLRGKPVPNMNSDNLLVGGTENEKSVGLVTEPTQLKLPPMIGKNLLGVKPSNSTSQETEVKFISGVKHKVVPGRGAPKWVYFDADWKATTVPSITYVSGLTLTTDPKLFDSQWTTIDRENASPHVHCRWIVRVQ